VADKTERPTARRLRQARKEGDSPVSAYAAQAVAFTVAVALVPGTVRALWAHASAAIRASLTSSSVSTMASLSFSLKSSALAVLTLLLPLLVTVGAAGAFAQLVQTGGVFAPARWAPKLDRLDPGAGFKRLFSASRLFAVLRALVAGVLVSALAYTGLRHHLVDLARTAGRPGWIGAVVAPVACAIGWRVALLGLGLGVLDWVVTRRAWLRRLRMSKEEVARELRESEGDPHVKAARERAHRELFAQATMASVRTARVVVVHRAQLACALRYSEGSGDVAPVVVAAGEGELAAGILRAAHSFGIPVVHDVILARALVELSVGETIPEPLYEAVAETLREVGQPQPSSERPSVAG
jgi:type III secretion protein U